MAQMNHVDMGKRRAKQVSNSNKCRVKTKTNKKDKEQRPEVLAMSSYDRQRAWDHTEII
jgi:hypothetical protein